MVGQPKIAPAPAGYTKRQIDLHWIVLVLVAFQFAIGNQMAHLFRAAHGGSPTHASAIWAPIHIVVGDVILIAMLARLVLRRRDGLPAPPKQHPALERLASAVHAGLYVDLIGARCFQVSSRGPAPPINASDDRAHWPAQKPRRAGR